MTSLTASASRFTTAPRVRRFRPTHCSVLVLDGEHRPALAVVRSLGRAGYAVHVASSVRRSLAGSSRHAASEVLVPHPLSHPADYAKAVAAHARDLGVDVVLPVTDEGPSATNR